MRFKSLTKIVCLLSVATVSGGILSAAPPAELPCTCASEAVGWNFPSEASVLLKEIRSSAHRLSVNAAKMNSFRHGGVSWHGHADELMLIREQINAVGERLQRLQAIRHAIAPWQQEAVDSVTPFAVTVASSTEAAIRHLNDNRKHLWSDSYQNHLKTVASQAEQMKKSVALHLELADTQDKVEALRDRIALIGS
jgi:hypothetical protein